MKNCQFDVVDEYRSESYRNLISNDVVSVPLLKSVCFER